MVSKKSGGNSGKGRQSGGQSGGKKGAPSRPSPGIHLVSSPNSNTSRNKSEIKSVPADWKLLMDAETISRAISRISFQIVEKHRDFSRLGLVGIRTCGEHIGKRIQQRIKEIEGIEVPFGVIDITLYRDDLSHGLSQPTLKGTDIPFYITGSRIVLIDDVFYTGRTIRAALDAIIDFGRPDCVELATLADRGHRELPIRPDYVGKNLPTQKQDFVRVRLSEQGFEDGVYLAPRRNNADDANSIRGGGRR